MSELARQAETGTGALEADLARRVVAEGLGTGLLIVAVIGSGIMATRLTPSDVGLQLLENAVATAGALTALIWTLGSVSGAHLNPVVSLIDRAFGAISTRDTGFYIAAQVIGGCLGAIVANLMFELPAVDWSATERSSGAVWLSEIVATAGLLLVIHGCVRSGRANVVAVAVGVWIGGAYFFTSSTSFANPAVTVARTVSDSFAGIAPSSVPMFILMQLVGAATAFILIRFLYPPDVATVAGAGADGTPLVLFLCVHNAGRSQMALGWFDHLARGRAVAWSGGSEPGTEINPAAVAAMAEVGIDITREFPKPWTDEIVRAADVVITMGCGDACPWYPGKRYEDWELDDPAGQVVAAVRPIRDEIRRRVEALLASLATTADG
jgi:arsenate reductase